MAPDDDERPLLPPMKTRKRHDVAGTARFLTFSCYRRLKLFENDAIKDRFVAHLVRAAAAKRARVLAWVVMREHVHLTVYGEDLSITGLLSSLKRQFSIEVLARWRELNAWILPSLRDRQGEEHFWQAGGGHDRNVWGAELIEKIAYTHRNPIARGLVASSVDWRWSSARAYERRTDAIGPPIAFDLVPPSNRTLT